jgi:alanyl-tRNA synthetase
VATERRYLREPFTLRFEARLGRVAAWSGRTALVLDSSAFYPEGGGQLGDQGTLRIGGVVLPIIDVQIDDDGEVFHVVDPAAPGAAEAAAALSPGAAAEGEIDAARRRDHMSQHTGQHMLSRALLDVAQAETVSSRLGASVSTIDVSIGGAGAAASSSSAGAPEGRDAGPLALEAVVERVNDAVLEDRPIRTMFPTASELASLPLRRKPKVDDGVRIIDIEGFDMSPCGGTHCTSTGQVGPVHVVGTERYKGLVRVSFVAGKRALRELQGRDAALRDLARSFNCGPLDVPVAVGKLRAELKAKAALFGTARGELVALLAERLLSAHPADPSGTTRIAVLREGDELGALRALAGALCRRPDVVALVASSEAGEGRGELLVVAERGAQAAFDAGKWLKETAAAHGGKGGGRPERAEGRLPAGVDWALVSRG